MKRQLSKEEFERWVVSKGSAFPLRCPDCETKLAPRLIHKATGPVNWIECYRCSKMWRVGAATTVETLQVDVSDLMDRDAWRVE